MIRRHAFFVCLACLFANPALAGQSATSSERPVVRLARPDAAPLTGDEIRVALSGHKLVLDEQFIQSDDIRLRVARMGGCPPVEIFLADERWEKTVCGIGVQVKRGAWRIKDRTICVRSNVSDERCRMVWRTGSPNQLILTVSEISGEFNPYKVVPLSDGR